MEVVTPISPLGEGHLDHPDVSDLSAGKPVDLDRLYPALVECFGIIFLGYIAGRFNIITEVEAKGMNTFVGSFSLPALIFISLCQLDLTTVNYTFLLSILIAKSILFFGVMAVTYAVVKNQKSSKTALYSIFVTQSNDFALGFPILSAIYGDSHPEYASYMYLLAPISLVILNPIGFIILEVNRVNSNDSQNSPEGAESRPRWRIILQVIQSIFTNPIIIMTILGMLSNYWFHSHMPIIISQFLKTLGSAFSSTALFLLGLRMVGKMDSFKGTKIIAPIILIALKLMAMPVMSREIVSLLHAGVNDSDTTQLANFAFLYGTFPAAPSVFVYAVKYNVLTEVIAGSMVVCTFVSAPIMFISARLLSIRDINPSDYINELDNFLLDVSVLSLLGTLWVAVVLIISRRWRCSPHNVTLALVFSQACGCVGAIFWSLMSCTHGWKLYLQFSFFAFGVYSARMNTALLSITLVLIQIRPACWVKKIQKYFLAVGFLIPAVLVLVLLLVVPEETPAHGEKTDPNFQYGSTQAYVALVILIVSFIVTSICVIFSQRFSSRRLTQIVPKTNVSSSEESNPLLAETEEEAQLTGNNSSDRLVPIEDLIFPPRNHSNGGGECGGQCCNTNSPTRISTGRRRYRCDSDHRAYCSSLVERYQVPPAQEAVDDHDDYDPNGLMDETQSLLGPRVDNDDSEILKHTVLLLLLLLSMFIGIALCIWTLVMDNSSGIYLELVFLDGFLNFGQGLFAFAVFGFDTRYILVPIRSCFRRIMYGQDSLVLPRWEDLADETKQLCQQFMKHHIANCMESVVRDVRVRLNVNRAVFKGSDLVDWLCEVGLARDRFDGVTYGRHLVKGRVIKHVDNYLDFHDDRFLYRFV